MEPLEQLAVPSLAVYTFQDGQQASGSAARLPEAARKQIEDLKASGELAGREFECVLIHEPAGLQAARLLVVGAGKSDRRNETLTSRMAAAAVRYLRARGIHEMSWVLAEAADAWAVENAVTCAVVADYDSDPYRTEREGQKRIERFAVSIASEPTEELAASAERGRVIGEAQNFVRDLVNEPSNILTPTELARRAQAMAKEFGLECEVRGTDEIRAMKMGAFWAVAQGSDEPPQLILVRYTPPGAPAGPVIGLVGKGITFDTGGISIKPATDMHEMKTDMAGAATMLGVMRVLAQLKPRVSVIAVVAAAENMPSGKACRPGDVVTSMSGKTIEILNTDAEGRLTLADALTYAKLRGATVLIDAATLTGAITVALGKITTGVFGRHQAWVDRILKNGSEVGERMWQMPVDDDYRELYKSMIADIANTGGRHGGAITAAMFVGEFAGDTPWVHLDIAGTSWSNEEKPYLAKGPTGAPMRTLVNLLTGLPKA